MNVSSAFFGFCSAHAAFPAAKAKVWGERMMHTRSFLGVKLIPGQGAHLVNCLSTETGNFPQLPFSGSLAS